MSQLLRRLAGKGLLTCGMATIVLHQIARVFYCRWRRRLQNVPWWRVTIGGERVQPNLHEPSAAPQVAHPTRRYPAESMTPPPHTDFQVGQHVNYYTSDGTFDAVVEIKKIHRDSFPYYYTIVQTYLPATRSKQPMIGSKPVTHLTPLNPLGPDQRQHQVRRTGLQHHQ